MKLPQLKELDLTGKKVLVKADLDINLAQNSPARKSLALQAPAGGKLKTQNGLFRLKALMPTLEYLIGKKAKIVVIGYRGRPKGKSIESLSLEPVAKLLEEIINDTLPKSLRADLEMHVMENLRFNPGEELNDKDYAKHLAESGDIYVNEAFSASHRKHASVVALPQEFKSKYKYESVAAGFRFVEEIENLSKVIDSSAGESKHPVVVIISGLKKDKLDYVKDFMKFADKILIGGRLPAYVDDNSNLKTHLPASRWRSKRLQAGSSKLIIANLLPDKEDITINSVEKFEREIEKAKTIVVSGPVGKFEDKDHGQGTERVFKAVAENKGAFKVAGGGETEKAISELKIRDKFDWISVGGGAMLEYLTTGTLPGIQALID